MESKSIKEHNDVNEWLWSQTEGLIKVDMKILHLKPKNVFSAAQSIQSEQNSQVEG